MTASDFLDRILERKRLEVKAAADKVPETVVRRRAEAVKNRRGFFDSLAAPGPRGVNIIAEIKRASPSKGLIRENLDPPKVAAAYETGGAAAMSVLTDTHYFQGCPDDLEKARQAVSLPVLRKDFLVSTYQIYETAAMGADAALLIVRALPKTFLKEALALCRELALDALVEVHTAQELETASWAEARLVGINNRDLTTFKIDIQNSVRLARHLEAHQVAVAESGIQTRADVETLAGKGIWNFLIGESLVKNDDPKTVLEHLLGSQGGQT